MARGGARPNAGRKPGGKTKRPPVPKLAHVGLQVAARRYTEDALNVVVAALKDESTTNRLSAAKEILDRGWGRPSQDTKIIGDSENPLRVVTKIVLVAGNADG